MGDMDNSMWLWIGGAVLLYLLFNNSPASSVVASTDTTTAVDPTTAYANQLQAGNPGWTQARAMTESQKELTNAAYGAAASAPNMYVSSLMGAGWGPGFNG